MSLQVRLRHTLGERLLELPDRTADEPVVVGRSGTADVQVPSVTVSPRHAVLFAHEGRWAVQPIPGTAGTFVNGAKIEGPAFLRVGDVVTLGNDTNAPAIDIDPIGASQGRQGQPAGSAAAAAPGVGVAPTRPQVPQPVQPAYPAFQEGAPAAGYAAGYGYPVPAQGPEVSPPPAMPPGWAQAGSPGEEAGAGDTIAWPTEASPTARYYGRRIRRRSDSGLGFAVLLTLVVAGAAGFYFYYQRQQTPQVVGRQTPPPLPPPATQPVRPTRPEEDTSQAPRSIFEKSTTRQTGKAGPRTAANAGKSAPDPGGAGGTPMDGAAGATPGDSDDLTIGTVEALPPDPADAAAAARPDPRLEEPAWKQVQAARFSQDRAKAVLKFDEYARLHPDQFAAQLAEYTDKVMDRVWFERLEQLCREREALGRSIQQTDREIAEETEDAYKKRVLVPLKEKYANRLQAVEEELKSEMKYDAPGAPNLLDDAQLDKLRRQRDPTFYSRWKNRVLAYVRRSHGELPWAQ